MTDRSSNKGLRDRIASGTEDRLGRALGDLLDNPLLNGAIGRASDAREKATQAQELAMGALNLPSAADMERLTRRLRSVSLRLEGIEDGVHRIGRALPGQTLDARLAAIEAQLATLSRAVGDVREGLAAKRGEAAAATGARRADAATSTGTPAAGKRPASKRSTAKSGGTANAGGAPKASGAPKAGGTAKTGEAAKSGQPAKSRQPAKITGRRRPAAND